jgi:glycosyltransferase involved in cell wall biosynthesis
MSARRISYGFLSSAPPTPCGLATFTAALATNLEQLSNTVSLVRVLDDETSIRSARVPIIGELIASDPRTIESATQALNRCDVVIVQHEYGLYGGEDGEDLLEVLYGLHVPVIAILHTVLSQPSSHQRDILNEVIKAVDAVVVMTHSAQRTLESVFRRGTTPIHVIAHGAVVGNRTLRHFGESRPIVLTWGLIGPGKGIEWVIDAMKELKDITLQPLYIIAGRTHPKVFAQQGERYRQMLRQRVIDNGVSHLVTFDDTYRDVVSLTSLIESADVVVLPYDSKDQATSGVLVDAVAAGRPVVATSFPHAIDLLKSGAGLVVPSGDAHAIATSIRRVVEDSELAADMAREARRLASQLDWRAVAVEYSNLSDSLFFQESAIA